MSNLLTSLTTASNSMTAYQNAMNVVENDTVNANTPGFVSQTVNLSAQPFDINGSQAGGVKIAGVLNSRDEYAERNVQTQQTAYNFSNTLTTHLAETQPIFDLQSTTGIAGSINSLFTSFSQLSVSPNDAQSRQGVLSAASGLASAFNVAATGLNTASSTADADTRNTVTDINNTIADISSLNVQLKSQPQTSPDPSLDARLHADLETLSQYAGITAQSHADGSVDVYLGGQRPLLVDTTQIQLSVASSSSGNSIQDSSGNDLTSYVSGGQLSALLQLRNTNIPSYQSRLNQLAQAAADTINTQLSSGVDQSGTAGSPLFTYTAGEAAQSLAVTSITGSQIAASSTANPGGNDNALALDKLQNSMLSSIGNSTLTQYIGSLSAQVGRDVANSQSDATTQQSLLSQAQNLRSQASSVSLNDEAARLQLYQESYTATSKLISVIDTMTATLISLIPAPTVI